MIVLTLQIDVAELMSNEQLAIKVDEGAIFISFHFAGDFLALLNSHNFAAIFAVENGIVGNLKSSL